MVVNESEALASSLEIITVDYMTVMLVWESECCTQQY